MKIPNHVLACLAVIAVFACFLACTGLPDHTRDFDAQSMRMIGLILKVGLLVVAGLTNMAYRLFSRNDRDSALLNLPDQPPTAEAPPAVIVQQISGPRKPHHCACGYDLRARRDAWMQYDPETPERCPECSRRIYREDYADLGKEAPKEKADLVGVGPESAQDRT